MKHKTITESCDFRSVAVLTLCQSEEEEEEEEEEEGGGGRIIVF